MPEKIVITRPMMLAVLLPLIGLAALLLWRALPDIQRELRIWNM